MDEMMDVVNDNDEVVGKASKKEIYQRNLMHRIVQVLVFNSKGEIFLQKRANTVVYKPGYYTGSACGHVISGETYFQAAKRELEEELGIKAELKEEFKFVFDDIELKIRKMVVVFSCKCENVEIRPEEVGGGRFFSAEEIKKMIKNGEKIHIEFIGVFERWLKGR